MFQNTINIRSLIIQIDQGYDGINQKGVLVQYVFYVITTMEQYQPITISWSLISCFNSSNDTNIHIFLLKLVFIRHFQSHQYSHPHIVTMLLQSITRLSPYKTPFYTTYNVYMTFDQLQNTIWQESFFCYEFLALKVEEYFIDFIYLLSPSYQILYYFLYKIKKTYFYY